MSTGRNPAPIRCVVYAAKSTADPHGSIPTQLDDCRKAIEREGGREIVDKFTDEAASAYKASRGPGLARARERAAQLAAENGAAELWCQHTDRLARGDGVSATHLVEVALWARNAHVRLRSVQDPQTCDGGFAFAAMMGDRAHEDSKRKADAVRSGLRRRARDRGKLVGGSPPFGYDWVGGRAEKELVVVPFESDVVGRIFAQYVGGVSQRAIARTLDSQGLRTNKGNRWTQSTIAKLLRNPIYIGRVRFTDRSGPEPVVEVYDGAHEAIVDRELWDRAQAMLDATARTMGHRGGRPPSGGHLLTSGLLRCGTCDASMLATTKPTRTPGRVYAVYECATRKHDTQTACPQAPVPRELVDNAMLRELRRTYLDLDAMRERLRARIASEGAAARHRQAAAERETQRVEAALARIDADYLAGELPAAEMVRLRADLDDSLEAARAEAAQAQAQAERLEAAAPVDDALVTQLAELRDAIVSGDIATSPDLDALRRLLRHVFVAVYYRPESVIPSPFSMRVALPGAHLEPVLSEEVVVPLDAHRLALERQELALAGTDNSSLHR